MREERRACTTARTVLLAIAVALATAPAAAPAAPGQPDTAFGSGGTAVLDLGYEDGSPPMSRGMATAFLPDGRIAVAGARSGGGAASQQLGLRLTGAGAFDTTFAAGRGWAATAEDRSGTAAAVFPDRDGGMTIAGTGGAAGAPTPQLLRLLPSGQIDGSFGSGGVSPPPEPGNAAFGLAAVRLGDGRVVVVGTSEMNGKRGVLAVRYTPGGQVDGSFGSGGRFRSQLASGSFGDSGLSGIAVEADGKLLVGGFRTDSQTGSDAARYVVAGRLTADGTPDAAFGEGGFTKIPLSSWGYYGDQHVAALPDGGMLLVLGDRTDSSSSRILVARLSADGTLVATRVIAAGAEPYPWAAAPGPEGKLVVVGHTRPEGDNNPLPFAVRVTPAGEADSGWGSGGVWIGSARGRADGVAVAGDGSVALTGATSDDKLTVTKLQGDGGAAPGGSGSGGSGGAGSGGGGESGDTAFILGRPVMRHGRLLVRLRCKASSACRGKASLLPRRGRGRALATKRFKVAATKAVRLKLEPRRRPRAARLRVTLSAPVRASRTMVVRLR